MKKSPILLFALSLLVGAALVWASSPDVDTTYLDAHRAATSRFP